MKWGSAVHSSQDALRLDRRKFLVGGWYNNRPRLSSQHGATIVIHVRPDRRVAVSEAIAELPGLAVKGHDAQGPLIASLSPATSDDVSFALLSIMDIAGVVNAVLTDHIQGRGDNV
ncbi:MAG: chaperone NapD [Alphaproteobacteria bacterium]|nr:chaperone NapD [Alphaproteobacteria bacterium]